MKHRRPVILASLFSTFVAMCAPIQGEAAAASESALAGIGVSLPPLSDHARQALTARAEAGDLDAMYELAHHALLGGDDSMGGVMYFWGKWNNPEEAEHWWRRAAALGDPKAMILLGHMYAEPWGVPQDLPKAAQWFEKAADLNSLEATRALADLYMGAWSDERDDTKANRWLLRAGSTGDGHAMLLLGLRYDAGWGIREDPAEAGLWYEKVIAADRNTDYPNDLTTAWNNLGALYEQGRGVPEDERKAAELYGKAAHTWSAAPYNLAVLCEAGRGVPRDTAAAIWLYREAASQQKPDAIAALKRLGFKIPHTAKEQNDEAGALLAHDKEQRTRTLCDP